MTFFRSRRSADHDAELPDLQPGSRRLAGPDVRTTASLRRPTDEARQALAAASQALGRSLDLLRRLLPADPSSREQVRTLEEELGRAQLPGDYARLGVMLDDLQVAQIVLETSSDTLDLFHYVVFGVTPIARGAALSGAVADLTDLSTVDEPPSLDALPVRRLLRVLETLAAFASRARDGGELLRLTIADVIARLATLSDEEVEHVTELEETLVRLTRAEEVEDLETLRRDLLAMIERALDRSRARGSSLGEAHAEALESQAKLDELQAALEAAQGEARVDALTGLANRRALEELVEQGRPEPLGVVAIDLDHFKAINDEHGHAGGDAVLRHVASLLHAELRGHDRAFRVGGEELFVLLERADWQGTRATAERLRSSLERHVIRLSSERAIRVTASFGVALWMPGHPFDAALAAADEALYRAKHGGRNRVVG